MKVEYGIEFNTPVAAFLEIAAPNRQRVRQGIRELLGEKR